MSKLKILQWTYQQQQNQFLSLERRVTIDSVLAATQIVSLANTSVTTSKQKQLFTATEIPCSAGSLQARAKWTKERTKNTKYTQVKKISNSIMSNDGVVQLDILVLCAADLLNTFRVRK